MHNACPTRPWQCTGTMRKLVEEGLTCDAIERLHAMRCSPLVHQGLSEVNRWTLKAPIATDGFEFVSPRVGVLLESKHAMTMLGTVTLAQGIF